MANRLCRRGPGCTHTLSAHLVHPKVVKGHKSQISKDDKRNMETVRTQEPSFRKGEERNVETVRTHTSKPPFQVSMRRLPLSVVELDCLQFTLLKQEKLRQDSEAETLAFSSCVSDASQSPGLSSPTCSIFQPLQGLGSSFESSKAESELQVSEASGSLSLTKLSLCEKGKVCLFDSTGKGYNFSRMCASSKVLSLLSRDSISLFKQTFSMHLVKVPQRGPSWRVLARLRHLS